MIADTLLFYAPYQLGTGSGQQACTLDVHVHGVPSELGYDVPAWEEHAFGYR